MSKHRHAVLKLLIEGDQVVVQSADASGEAETLYVDLASGKVGVTTKPSLPASATQALGVVGVLQLANGAALVVVTEAQQVATLLGSPVFRVTRTRVITGRGSFSSAEQKLLSLLQDAVDPDGSGRGMLFSYGLDITLTEQRRAESTQPDPRFFWNGALSRPLSAAGAHAFVLPMVLGFVGQFEAQHAPPGSSSAAPLQLQVTLIARKSVERAGTRHWRRGADQSGNAANFTESEQVVTVRDAAGTAAAFVQTRGSIPMLWTQIPNVKYKPPTVILDDQRSSAALDRHFDAMQAKYQHVVAINLVSHHGSEGKLEGLFKREAERWAAAHPAPGGGGGSALKYVPFDFHKQCGSTRYDRLDLLWAKLQPDFQAHGFWLQREGRVVSSQHGVFRTNCIDCLDRTNVVQGVLGRKALEAILVEIGVMRKGESLHTAMPQVEQKFKILWADHGDAVSRQYAGTGALKSGFTRTGKRTLDGFIDDGIKSAARYYLNNFQDGSKQDAIDLVTGAYKIPDGISAVRFKGVRSPLLPLLLALAVLFAALAQAAALLGDGQHDLRDPHWQQRVLLPAVGALLLLLGLFRNKKSFVNKPQLCPHLADTVQFAAAGKS